MILHQNALQAARITELEEQLAAITQRKTCKQKRIQQDGTMEYSEQSWQQASQAGLIVIDNDKQTTVVSVQEDTSQEMI
jgi:hypothetical protein